MQSFKRRSLLTGTIIFAALVVMVLWLSVAAPVAAQPPQGGDQGAMGARGQGGAGGARGAGGRGGGGGGFRQPDPLDFEDHDGWTQIFDGQTMNNWDGDPNVWSVVDGALTATSTPENPTGTTYLIWRGGEPADFELKLELQILGGGNTGIQYRSMPREPRARPAVEGEPPRPQTPARWNVGGYQLDFDFTGRYPGQLYENAGNAETGEGSRGIITYRGQVVQLIEGKNPRIVASLGDADELKGYYNINGWNQIHLIARGGVLAHIVNGHLMTLTFDEDPTRLKTKGLITVQIESRDNCTVAFRNIWLREL